MWNVLNATEKIIRNFAPFLRHDPTDKKTELQGILLSSAKLVKKINFELRKKLRYMCSKRQTFIIFILIKNYTYESS